MARALIAPVVLLVACCLLAGPASAQEVDASKPTNFYPLLGNNLEYNARDAGGNLMGYRAELIYPPSQAHLFLFELPLLYNDTTEKFGVGDLRARYFWLPYKNYDNFFGAFGPSIDIFVPTGSFEDGLGSSSWSVSVAYGYCCNLLSPRYLTSSRCLAETRHWFLFQLWRGAAAWIRLVPHES